MVILVEAVIAVVVIEVIGTLLSYYFGITSFVPKWLLKKLRIL